MGGGNEQLMAQGRKSLSAEVTVGTRGTWLTALSLSSISRKSLSAEVTVGTSRLQWLRLGLFPPVAKAFRLR